MADNSNSQEHEFYHEIDKRRSKSSCSCGVLFTIFIIFIIIGSAFIYIGISKAKQRLVRQPAAIANEISLKSAIDKISLMLKGSEGSLNRATTITITESELSSLIYDASSGQDIGLSNPRVTLTPGKINLFGDISSPLKSQIAIILVPSVESSQIALKIDSMTAGTLPIPPWLASKITKPIVAALSHQLNKPGVKYQSITVMQGVLQATALVDKPK